MLLMSAVLWWRPIYIPTDSVTRCVLRTVKETMAGKSVVLMFFVVLGLVRLTGSQVITGPSSNVMGGRQGCQYEFTATVQDADLVGWFSWAGTQIDKNDTGSHHLYPEVRSDGDAMFARLVVDQAVEDTTLFTLMALKSGASPVQHAFDLVVLEGSLPISASVNSKGVSSSSRNVSLANYTLGDSIPLECVVEGCRSFDQLTIEWVDPEGTVIDEYSGEFTQGQRVFSHNLPVSKSTQRGSYHCRVRTSLRQVSYAVTAFISLQGELASPSTVTTSSDTASNSPRVTIITSVPTSGSSPHLGACRCLPWLVALAAVLCTSNCLRH